MGGNGPLLGGILGAGAGATIGAITSQTLGGGIVGAVIGLVGGAIAGSIASGNFQCQDVLEVGDVIEGLPNSTFPIALPFTAEARWLTSEPATRGSNTTGNRPVATLRGLSRRTARSPAL